MNTITPYQILNAIISFCFDEEKLQNIILRLKEHASENLLEDEETYLTAALLISVIAVLEIVYKVFDDYRISSIIADNLFTTIEKLYPSKYDLIFYNYLDYLNLSLNNNDKFVSFGKFFSNKIWINKDDNSLLVNQCIVEFTSLLIQLENFLNSVKENFIIEQDDI
ncbi:MAG: hypothetical protein QXD05_00075 [Candidatus Pacearchaeota archaeon]